MFGPRTHPEAKTRFKKCLDKDVLTVDEDVLEFGPNSRRDFYGLVRGHKGSTEIRGVSLPSDLECRELTFESDTETISVKDYPNIRTLTLKTPFLRKLAIDRCPKLRELTIYCSPSALSTEIGHSKVYQKNSHDWTEEGYRYKTKETVREPFEFETVRIFTLDKRLDMFSSARFPYQTKLIEIFGKDMDVTAYGTCDTVEINGVSSARASRYTLPRRLVIRGDGTRFDNGAFNLWETEMKELVIPESSVIEPGAFFDAPRGLRIMFEDGNGRIVNKMGFKEFDRIYN